MACCVQYLSGQKKTFFVACGAGLAQDFQDNPRNIANAGRCVIGFHRDPLLPGQGSCRPGTVDHIHYGRWLEWWRWHEIPFRGTQPSLRGDDVGKFSTMAWSFFLSGERIKESDLLHGVMPLKSGSSPEKMTTPPFCLTLSLAAKPDEILEGNGISPNVPFPQELLPEGPCESYTVGLRFKKIGRSRVKHRLK